MIKNLSYLFLSLFLVLNFSSPAVAEVQKDSFYFMKDDNEFSDEEKDEEALYVHGICQQNVFQRTYFDCACIAGAFRQERDKEDLVPQANLLNSLYSDKRQECINKVAIAGDAYEFCQHYARTYRSREKNNQQYCECVANKVARDFAKRPELRANYISALQTDALISCGRQN